MPSWLTASLLSIALGFGTGWKVHSWKTDSEVKAEEDKAEVVADDKAVKHEQFKEKERIRYVTITKNVDRIVKEPFYLTPDQCLDDDGLRELREAINPGSTSINAPALPASGGTE